MDLLKNLSTSQIWAQARQYITFIAGIAATLGFITVAQQGAIVDNAEQIATGLKELIGAVSTIVGGVVLIINLFKANKAASPEEAVKRVQGIATQPQTLPESARSFDAKKALVDATNSIPEVQGVVTSSSDAGVKLALATPAPTVVPAGTPEAVIVAQGEVPR